MAYTSWSVVFGEQPSAAKWNLLGANDASFNDGTGIAGLYKNLLTVDSNPYKFSAYRTAALTSSNTDTTVQHDTELFDTNGNFDVTTNKGRYTAPVSGFYFFSALAGNTTANSTNQFSTLYVNGSRIQLGNGNSCTTTTGQYSTVMGLVQLAANDYIEHKFVGGAGSTMGVGSRDVCYFMGALFCRT